ncbi:MAG TPA: class I SAM-dependent methyltransferase [Chthoniobacterales bacterium]|jgi:SAM-dependent methyltransferase|nr:class I SAM-dependent methyltransferase [Chthoniobacterales bacterium]
MKLSHKVAKLFSPEALESVYEHASRSTHPVNARRILATLDRAEVAKLREHYPGGPNFPKINRFADVPYWIKINVERAQDLWLDRTSPRRILDLGCGAGYFLYICKFFGHEVLGLDLDEQPLFRDTLALLQVPRMISRIDPNVPLPDLGRKFDLVAAHRICFQRIEGATSGKEWTALHWKFFIDDIRSRFLNPTGRLLLDFNPRPDGSSFFTRELRSFFLSQGARIRRSKALFAANPFERPRFRQTNHP